MMKPETVTKTTAATDRPHLHLVPSLARSRRTLSPRIGYAVAALVVGLGLFASVTPSPLYRSYSVLWHFSPLTLTLIYATYAFGVLASLLLAGGVSDDVGRRPVLLAALGRSRLKAERPRVPAVTRRPFLLAALAVLSSWSIGGLFFSLGPQLAAHLFNSSNVIVSGSGIVALAGAAVVAQLLTARTAPWIGASVGSIALAPGMVLIVFAAARDSSAAYLAGSILGGAGFGAAFLGGLRALAAAIPHQHRAAVMSAFYVAAYTSLSLPAVLAGIVVTHVALPPTFELFGSVVAAIALIVAFEAWRTRPNPRPVDA